MVPGPYFCVQEDDFHSYPSSPSIPSSGRESPHERQHMPPSETTQSMRHAAALDNIQASSSYDSPADYSRSYDNMPPPSPRLAPPIEFSPKTTPQNRAHHSKIIHLASGTSQPNPPIPHGPHMLSPFSRPGSRGSTKFTKMPSEESRALSSTNPSHSRGPMVLYRKAETQDDPSPLPYAKHHPTLPIDPLSSDSKYPVGTMIPEHGLVPYAWDPLLDDLIDEEDDLDEKTMYDPERSMSLRGFVNIVGLIVLLSALLSLFVMYPVYRYYHDNGRNELIVGNTRINSTGQASSVDFDLRSQIPMTPLSVGIDPATPQEALIRSSKDGVSYRLVFSDEFNTDGRSFYGDDDPFWEAVDDQLHDHKLVTTQNGYLVLKSRAQGPETGARTRASLKQRTSFCLDGGFIEIVVSSSTENIHMVWAGSWTNANVEVPTQGASLSELVLLQLALELGPAETVAIDFVRYYQRAESSSRSCDGDTALLTFEGIVS